MLRFSMRKSGRRSGGKDDADARCATVRRAGRSGIGAAARNRVWSGAGRPRPERAVPEGWCPGAELNHRHPHFQCGALPTELPGRATRNDAYRQNRYCCPQLQGRPHRGGPSDGPVRQGRPPARPLARHVCLARRTRPCRARRVATGRDQCRADAGNWWTGCHAAYSSSSAACSSSAGSAGSSVGMR